VKKRIVLPVVFVVFLAASAHAQKTDFFDLATSGMPQDVQTALDKGADVNAAGLH
jgi:hypothetical protein